MERREIEIPISKARRELTKLGRILNKEPETVYILTKNGTPVSVLTSVKFYEEQVKAVELLTQEDC